MHKTPAAVTPPIEPMLAKVADELPAAEGFMFEPKWDGFRAIVFRHGDEAYIQSRDKKSLNRYFPELERVLKETLPRGCVIDGEIIIATKTGLDFDALQQRIHPAPTRVAKLAKETPASFVAFDLLSAGGRSTQALPQHERRARLERMLAAVRPPIYITPATQDREQALQWLKQFEGAGLDGVMAKPLDKPYQPAKRTMFKIKHVRTADCVVAGFRWYKEFTDGVVGSLLLGLYDDAGVLQHAGVTSSFAMEMRRQLAQELEPLRKNADKNHPWKASVSGDATEPDRIPGVQSRWSGDKDMSWQPLRPERVVEVKYDHMEGDRFRHATTFVRWRDDKPPADCRYDQLEVAEPFELAQVLGAKPSRPSGS